MEWLWDVRRLKNAHNFKNEGNKMGTHFGPPYGSNDSCPKENADY